MSIGIGPRPTTVTTGRQHRLWGEEETKSLQIHHDSIESTKRRRMIPILELIHCVPCHGFWFCYYCCDTSNSCRRFGYRQEWVTPSCDWFGGWSVAVSLHLSFRLEQVLVLQEYRPVDWQTQRFTFPRTICGKGFCTMNMSCVIFWVGRSALPAWL